MPAAEYNLVLEQGASFQRVLTYKIDGTPVNLTGYSARLQIRASVSDATPVADLSTGNGGIALGGALGTLTLNLSAAMTAALSFVTGVYDLEIQAPDGTVTRLLRGRATLSPEVSR